MSKYKAKKCIIDDIEFDSKAEGAYYLLLKKLLDEEKIESFELQPVFTLQKSCLDRDGKKIKPINLKADFIIYHLDGKPEIVDIKGYPTPVSLLKRKMFIKNFPQSKLIWLSYVKKYSGFIDYFDLMKIRRENRKKKALLKSKQGK